MIKLLIILINVFSFVICVYDKFAAKNGMRRIPEKTLLGTAAMFGSVGMLAGMYIFRHKTKHKSFTVLVPLFFVIQALILAFTPLLWII